MEEEKRKTIVEAFVHCNAKLKKLPNGKKIASQLGKVVDITIDDCGNLYTIDCKLIYAEHNITKYKIRKIDVFGNVSTYPERFDYVEDDENEHEIPCFLAAYHNNLVLQPRTYEHLILIGLDGKTLPLYDIYSEFCEDEYVKSTSDKLRIYEERILPNKGLGDGRLAVIDGNEAQSFNTCYVEYMTTSPDGILLLSTRDTIYQVSKDGIVFVVHVLKTKYESRRLKTLRNILMVVMDSRRDIYFVLVAVDGSYEIRKVTALRTSSYVCSVRGLTCLTISKNDLLLYSMVDVVDDAVTSQIWQISKLKKENDLPWEVKVNQKKKILIPQCELTLLLTAKNVEIGRFVADKIAIYFTNKDSTWDAGSPYIQKAFFNVCWRKGTSTLSV